MSFVTWAALAIAVLVAAPILAHLLRRRPPEERPFAAVALVPERTAVAQRRAALEDRALFAVRAAAVVLLALLGATPLLRCSRLSLARPSGASVAIAVVVDDSLSMQAPLRGAAAGARPSRFERALAAAHELVTALVPGDAVAVVMAGHPARVVLGATTNLGAASETLEALRPSDRATDLEGAVQVAAELLRDLEHVDKRVVLLSDMADGRSAAGPLAAPSGVTLWAPLEPLREARDDCAVVAADRAAERVRARVACGPRTPAEASPPRALRLRLRAGAHVIVEAPVRLAGDAEEIALALPEGTSREAELVAELGATGGERYVDAIAGDDAAPVLELGGELRVGVVADPATRVATGGPPPIEQALAALALGMQVVPLPSVPDRADELAPLGAIIVDDVAGLTPEQRRAVEKWIEQGGVLLLALGPRAAHAPLGSGFAPMLPALVRWTRAAPGGLDPASDELFLEAAGGMDRLGAQGRAQLELEPAEGLRAVARWQDGAPLVLEHRMGRGLAYSVTLPLGTEHSDFVLRLGFLALCTRVVEAARSLGGRARTTVGASWPLAGYGEVRAWRVSLDAERRREPVATDGQLLPDRIGLYELDLDGTKLWRVAALDERELDLRPREVAGTPSAEALGGTATRVDVSAQLATALLVLLLLELGLRAWPARRKA